MSSLLMHAHNGILRPHSPLTVTGSSGFLTLFPFTRASVQAPRGTEKPIRFSLIIPLFFAAVNNLLNYAICSGIA